jgi:hypothetical protein
MQEKQLAHREDAEKFYRALAIAGQQVRVGRGDFSTTGSLSRPHRCLVRQRMA